jgi:hypothetical protein
MPPGRVARPLSHLKCWVPHSFALFARGWVPETFARKGFDPLQKRVMIQFEPGRVAHPLSHIRCWLPHPFDCAQGRLFRGGCPAVELASVTNKVGAPSFRVLCERVGGRLSISNSISRGYKSVIPALAKDARTGHPHSWWCREKQTPDHPPSTASFPKRNSRQYFRTGRARLQSCRYTLITDRL